MLYCAIAALCLVLGVGVYWLHTEIKREGEEAIEASKGIRKYDERIERERRESFHPIGVIDANYKFPLPNSKQSKE